jgi:fructokinase
VIVVCGEALIDLVPDRAAGAYAARPGGSPANVAVGLGRLGVDVALLSRLADDRFGALLREHVSASRVNLALAARSAAPTTLAVVNLDRAGVATYDFYIDGCADGTWRREDLPETLPEDAALHLAGSLALPVPAMGDVCELLLRRERARRVITFDPNIRPVLVRDEAAVRTRLRRWLGLADIVKASAEDVAWIAPGQPVEAVAQDWYGLGPTLVVVTRGENGVYAVGPGGPADLAGKPVTVVDTVGAGDAFMSGLLAALEQAGRLARPALAGLTAAQLTDALGYAQRVAALTCTRVGADPPWREELARQDEELAW